MRTEFNTARSRAAFGAKFKEFEETKHLYPMAEWTPSRAKVPDENHKKLWGTRLPLDDPFWNNHMPGDRWECKCGLKRSNGPEVKPKGKLKAAEAGLKGNPAKTGKVFSNDHPHIKGTSKPDKRRWRSF